ncbi:hypothetical protein ScPMuIL_018915 [Solemya velum]
MQRENSFPGYPAGQPVRAKIYNSYQDAGQRSSYIDIGNQSKNNDENLLKTNFESGTHVFYNAERGICVAKESFPVAKKSESYSVWKEYTTKKQMTHGLSDSAVKLSCGRKDTSRRRCRSKSASDISLSAACPWCWGGSDRSDQKQQQNIDPLAIHMAPRGLCVSISEMKSDRGDKDIISQARNLSPEAAGISNHTQSTTSSINEKYRNKDCSRFYTSVRSSKSEPNTSRYAENVCECGSAIWLDNNHRENDNPWATQRTATVPHVSNKFSNSKEDKDGHFQENGWLDPIFATAHADVTMQLVYVPEHGFKLVKDAYDQNPTTRKRKRDDTDDECTQHKYSRT